MDEQTNTATCTRVDDLAARARSSLSAHPRPFVRWAGSKRRLLPQIVEYLPATYGHYWEPFLGGGSLLFLLRPPRCTVADACSDLIKAFRAVRDGPRAVIRHLGSWPVNASTYYSVRALHTTSRFEAAAKFIYLNKTCWNGLYRVNSSGQFNVPYGKPKSNVVLDPPNLLACSDYLRAANPLFRTGDFEETVDSVSAGDLVFLDPPYVTRHNNNGFTDYNEKLFTWHDQCRLANFANKLTKAGAYVVVTNAMHRDVLDLYPQFSVVPLNRHSTLASNSAKRTAVTEALILSRSTL